MCGRFVSDMTAEYLANYFDLKVYDEIRQCYNIAPSSEILAVRGTNSGNELAWLRWGLVPSWAKDPGHSGRMINARSESVHEKPAFRQAVRYRRCIIPARGFYEWTGKGGKKQPYYFRMKDGNMMCFAGIWDQWLNRHGELLETCAILTVTANSLVRTIHDRMPAILSSDHYRFWLDRTIVDSGMLQSLFTPYPAEKMELYPVSPLVNNPRNDSVECIAPLL